MSLKPTQLLHCGASRVAFLQMGPGRDGKLRIEKYAVEVLHYEVNRDEKWQGALVEGIGRLRFRLKLRMVNPVLLLPGFRVLNKRIRAPHVSPKQQHRMVGLEGQRNLPGNLEEFTWDWQLIRDDGIETEVQFLAANRVWLEGFCRQLEGVGIHPQKIVPDSLLDGNAWRWLHAGDKGPVLIVNMGARSTNLTLIGDSDFAAGTIHFGGNLLTLALARAMGISTAAAEQRKRAYSEKRRKHECSEQETELYQSEIKSFLKRLNAEISRSLMGFRRNSGSSQPRQLLLAGGGALLCGLEKSLVEKQQLPVAPLYRGDRVEWGPEVDATHWESPGWQMTEALGVAAGGDLENPADVDLLPETERKRQMRRRQQPRLLAAAFFLLLAALMPLYFLQKAGSVSDDWSLELQSLFAHHEGLALELAELQEHLVILEDLWQDLDRSLASRTHWIEFFQELQVRLIGVGDVWLDELQISRRSMRVVPQDSEAGFDPLSKALPLLSEEKTVYRMNLSGNLLLRQRTDGGESPVTGNFDQTIITERIRTLIQQFGEIEYVMETGMPTIFWTRLEDGVLPFSFNLTVNPDRPL